METIYIYIYIGLGTLVQKGLKLCDLPTDNLGGVSQFTLSFYL
jgi:hypothetical protein